MKTSLVLLPAALALPAPATALTFSGHFSGIAHVQEILAGHPDHPASYFDGAVITGTFRGDIPDAHLATLDPSQYAGLGGGATDLVFEMRGYTFAFPGRTVEGEWGGLMTVFDAAGPGDTQQVTFNSNFYSIKYHGSWFQFTSPDESMFQRGDETTLRIGADTVTGFDAFFKDSEAGLYVDIDITSFGFDVVSPVPEPGAALLFASGLAGVGLMRRARRARTGDGAAG